MRIVGGAWAGRALVSPSGRVRPTAEPVRDATMALVADAIPGARALDLFAGTGALGLEALSRGAASCDFVENNPSALHALKANVAAVRIGARCRIFKQDAIPFVERLVADHYDIAFADPPWGSRKLDRIVARWLEIPYARLLVLEHEARHQLPVSGETRRLGDGAVTVLVARVAPARAARG